MAPPFCTGCKTEGSWLCHECFQKLEPFWLPIEIPCPAAPDGVLKVWCACQYQSALKKMVKLLKYSGVKELGSVMADLIALFCPLPEQVQQIMPVPLHPRRQWNRGFNQAEQIALPLATFLGIEYHNNRLTRAKHSANFASITHKDDRAAAAHGMFVVAPEAHSAILGQTILLVDDVCTSGATLAACATALYQAGAAQCYATAVAHGGS